MRQILRQTLLALVFAPVGVASASAAAGDWHGDVAYAATASAPNAVGIRIDDERMPQEETPFDGGAVVDVGVYLTPLISPVIQIAADVQRIAWASEDIEFDLSLLRADLLGGVRLLPPGSGEHPVDVFADVLVGVERVSVPNYHLPEDLLIDAELAPSGVLSLGVLAGSGRIRGMVALRLRFTYIGTAHLMMPSCVDSPCISWGYGLGGGTVQVLLGAAFR
ncbi:MAG: hypothetical protein JXB39_15210 [Deltaproteobacteria bacterium]|nr:hypothetical protein [Deltaproteobacteria bacterium]